MPYRPDIEGLRAVAILLVVAAHGGVPGFQAGFIGVDIFFVVSGYLITGLLVDERIRTGRIDIARFYARRFRRLLPALWLMLLVAGLLASQLLPLRDRPDEALAGAAAALWLSNLHFAFRDIDYFASDESSNLFLHTWSLGVEEQFYLVWPALIALLMVRTAGGPARTRPLQVTMWVVLVTSFLACLWLTSHAGRLAFYLMPARAWQFAAGALAFLLLKPHADRTGTPLNDRTATALGLAGIAGIASALLLLDKSRPYPGVAALLPTAATGALICAGVLGRRNPVTAMLSLAPMQSIGRVSYSWYLWHWPVLILGASLLPAHLPSTRLLLIVLSLLIAVVCWYWFEAPIRRNEALVRKPRNAIALALALSGAAVTCFFLWGGHSQEVIAEQATRGESRYRTHMARIYSMGCDDFVHSAELKPCRFGNIDAPRTAIAIGDSVGLQWFPAFERIFVPPEWQLIVLTKSACPIVDQPFYYARIGREYRECLEWRGKALEFIVATRADVVIMGSADGYAFSERQWIDGTRSVLDRIAPSAENVFLVRSSPLLPFDGRRCLEWRSWLHDALAADGICSAPLQASEADPVFHALTTAAEPWPNAHLIDMNDEICPAGICTAQREVDGPFIYHDRRHLDADFAAILAPILATRLQTKPQLPHPEHADPAAGTIDSRHGDGRRDSGL